MPDRRHLWRGIHDPAMVASGLSAKVMVDAEGAHFELTNSGVGHAFPTYITPKVVMHAVVLDGDGNPRPETTRSHVIQRVVRFGGGRWVEHLDSRLMPGRAAALTLPWQGGTRARIWLEIHPDDFYDTEVYDPLLEQLPSDGMAARLIAEADRRAGDSRYRLFETEAVHPEQAPLVIPTCIFSDIDLNHGNKPLQAFSSASSLVAVHQTPPEKNGVMIMLSSARTVRPFVAAALLAAAVLAAPVSAAQPPGVELFESKGCSGCHQIAGTGGEVAAALDTVGERYTTEWLYTWLKDPAAVKPGTLMPNLDLSDDERAHLVFFLTSLRGSGGEPVAAVRVSSGFRSNPPDLNAESPENAYLALGTEDDFVETQRYTLQDQIQSFIPPNYEPAVTQSAFVLPPGSLRTQIAWRDATKIDEKDVFGQDQIGAGFAQFDLERNFVDFDMFLGLDDNFTLRLNIPIANTSLTSELNPNFLPPVKIFPNGSYTALGDISLFLKKKFVDQGNFPIGIAGIASLRLPTGDNKERFDPRTSANIDGVDMLLPLPAVDDAGMPIAGTADGTFRRFANDGRLPAPLQPGIGTVGGAFGLALTRQFDDYALIGRSAVHAGALYEIRPGHDGVDPGNLLTSFVTLVKPVYRDNVSIDLSYIMKHQGDDFYAGKMLVPTMTGPMVVDRPSFSGGTTQFAAGSLIIIPNPLFRIAATGLFRFDHPERGPAPDIAIRIALQYTFASGLYRK